MFIRSINAQTFSTFIERDNLMEANKYPRGSEWRKWDLHVHTPLSMVHNYSGSTQEEKWEKFISDLEALPKEFKVIGINDYLFIDGYEKVLEYKRNGRLQNIDTFFPVIEFRIKKFGGNKLFKRINFHIIFSDKLTVDIIKQQFLNSLYGKYTLAPGAEGIQWGGVITQDSLADLGKEIKKTVPADKLGDFGSDLQEGFDNINFDEEEIVSLLEKSVSYLKGKYLTAIGKTEWDAFTWDDGSIAEKKTVINKANFVFTSAENIEAFNKAQKKLADNNVNSMLLDCSDAHTYSTASVKDRIGKCFTWIKADPTFEGLRQTLFEPDRIFVGAIPGLVQRINSTPNKFIKEILIQRISGCTMSETWFDNVQIPINASMVAVIGNKGNGKSALTDIIGLVGNSYNDNYSFLRKDKFRKPKPYNKAANIEASITWADGTVDGLTTLDTPIDTNRVEKVKYIPQNFLEKLCASEEPAIFEDEIKKIIFSHTPVGDRLGLSSLEELINYKSEIINNEIAGIKTELDGQNNRIISLERRSSDKNIQSLKDQLKNKEEEYEMHQAHKPTPIAAPQTDEELAAKNKLINDEITTIKNELAKKLSRQSEINTQKNLLLIQISELQKVIQSIEGSKTSIDTLKEAQRPVLAKYSIDVDQIINLTITKDPITKLIEEKSAESITIETELKGDGKDIPGLNKEIEISKSSLTTLEQRLDEPYRVYQQYLNEQADWSERSKNMLGDKSTPNTIEYIKDQIDFIANKLPEEIEKEFQRRDEIVSKLFEKKSEIIKLYSDSYKPISDFISEYGHLMKEYQISLSVDFTLDGFIEKFFDHVSQGARGSFIGVEEGTKYLNEIISDYNLNDKVEVIGFLKTIRESLFFDKRADQKTAKREVEQQLKRGYTNEDLYRFLYSLEYLKPTFKLNLGKKTLTELSPGERGALLLIFYLFLDTEDKPLLIDQPEENLDNQSVYNYLVHFIKEAKKRRQIIIVTHNPNLAVVCDAEQIIHMSIDKSANYKASYTSGSIENPSINKVVVDILEGTRPAFKNRTDKYTLSV